ncbi:MAG: hypothetical protein WA976_04940, partial [Candidatus Dormiibacterota bacterium]
MTLVKRTAPGDPHVTVNTQPQSVCGVETTIGTRWPSTVHTSPIAPPLLVPAAGAHSVVRYGVQVGGAVGGTVVQLWIWAGWV